MLIDKRIERLIKLIYKLSLEDSVNKEELVLDLNCSIRTVDYTLAELQQTFVTKSSSMKIELKPDSILQLSGKDELVIREMLHRLYLQDDMVRFFLEAIAHQQKANTFVEKHFISRATFFSQIKKYQYMASRLPAFLRLALTSAKRAGTTNKTILLHRLI